ncbi:hypothetical protein ABZ345_04010 [Lentzea sp. NPDC005914]|uniref:hypothetical protein n=1 Tax=Lentzea sp. NPDC005914 TaxID=3154572 RepID=UPI0033EB0247
MTPLALVGPPHLTASRIPAAQGVYRIGRGQSAVAAVSFDPSDERRRQNLLTWFERGGEPGATLLIDDWKLCAESDPGLADAVRWITTMARGVQVIITARALGDLPDGVRLAVEVLDFLSLHGIHDFSKTIAWKGRWWKVPIGVDGSGEPVVVELTRFADGKWRTGSHLSVTAPDAFRSLVLGLMTTHSPRLFQTIFIDAHDTDTFSGLDQAPHVQSHHRHAAKNPARLADALLAESARRLEVVGNTWTIFHHRGFDQVLPQLLVCVTGLEDIIAAEPSFASDLAIIAKDVRQSGMQLLLDSPHATADLRIDDCTAPANLDELAISLPLLMHRDEPAPDFFTLHEMPKHAWRPRPVALQYRAPVGADEHGQPVEVDLKSTHLQDGMGPHGEVVAPPERRAEALNALILGQMLRHSPDDLRVTFIGGSTGLDEAPHVWHGDLLDDLERRTRTLAEGGYRTIWDLRAARPAGTPLPELLICVNGVRDLVEADPEFLNVLKSLSEAGRSYGQHLLLADSIPSDWPGISLSYRLVLTEDGWTRRISRSVESFVLPTDLAGVTRSLPVAMRG